MMFTRWLEGEGRKPKTWRTLITAFHEADLSSVAHELDEMISCTNEVKTLVTGGFVKSYSPQKIGTSDSYLYSMATKLINSIPS